MLVYDGNGNVTDDGQFTYTYDAFNRQISVRSKGTGTPLVAQYFYDATGERAAAIRYNSVGTAITYTQYLRDGSQVVYEKTWTISGTTLTPQGDKTYILAGGRMAVTRQTVNSTTTFTYYATDHLGTVRATVTVNTAGTEQYRTLHDYEPFGLELPVKDTVSPNTHKFTGHERDAETGNDYMHFRMFEASFGRFMKPDSIMGNLGNPQSWNLYSYVHGNPVNFNDPTGHMAGVAWRGYTWAGGDIAGSMGIHQEANAYGGGIGLGASPLDSGYAGPEHDSLMGLAALITWAEMPHPSRPDPPSSSSGTLESPQEPSACSASAGTRISTEGLFAVGAVTWCFQSCEDGLADAPCSLGMEGTGTSLVLEAMKLYVTIQEMVKAVAPKGDFCVATAVLFKDISCANVTFVGTFTDRPALPAGRTCDAFPRSTPIVYFNHLVQMPPGTLTLQQMWRY